MAHEQTVTVQIDGRYFNIPTVFPGSDQMHPEVRNHEAISRFIDAGLPHQPSGGFGQLEQALAAAKYRSESFNNTVHDMPHTTPVLP